MIKWFGCYTLTTLFGRYTTTKLFGRYSIFKFVWLLYYNQVNQVPQGVRIPDPGGPLLVCTSNTATFISPTNSVAIYAADTQTQTAVIFVKRALELPSHRTLNHIQNHINICTAAAGRVSCRMPSGAHALLARSPSATSFLLFGYSSGGQV